jgi:hypothetical protein
MQTLSMAIGLFLAIVAAFHFYWSLGGTYGWAKAVPQKIDGTPLFVPSKILTAMVALVLLMFAIAPIIFVMHATSFPPSNFQRIGLCVIGVIFLARGFSWHPYMGLFKSVRSTDFARNDTWFYSPACIALGIGTLILSIMA